MCLSHLIYTVRPCLIHTCHAMPRPCRSSQAHSTAQHGRRETAVLCCGLEKNGMVGAWHGHGHGHGMASVNQTRPHCVNQMGKTHYKTLSARHGRGTAWAWHAVSESAFRKPCYGRLHRLSFIVLRNEKKLQLCDMKSLGDTESNVEREV